MFDLESACGKLPIQTFADGDLVIAEGKAAPALYFLKSGKIAAYRGSEKIIEMETPGSVFGDVATLLDCPALTDTRAIGESSFYVAKDPEAFLLEHPEVALHVAKELARKLHFMSTYLTDIKQQYGGTGNHLSMINEVLDSFLHKP